MNLNTPQVFVKTAFGLLIFAILFGILAEPAADRQPAQQHPVEGQQHNPLNFAVALIGFALPLAVQVALQPLGAQLSVPWEFQLLSVAVILSYTFLFLGKFMAPDYQTLANVFQRTVILFSTTATFLAFSIPLSPLCKCITWTIYFLFLTTLVILDLISYRNNHRVRNLGE